MRTTAHGWSPEPRLRPRGGKTVGVLEKTSGWPRSDGRLTSGARRDNPRASARRSSKPVAVRTPPPHDQDGNRRLPPRQTPAAQSRSARGHRPVYCSSPRKRFAARGQRGRGLHRASDEAPGSPARPAQAGRAARHLAKTWFRPRRRRPPPQVPRDDGRKQGQRYREKL